MDNTWEDVDGWEDGGWENPQASSKDGILEKNKQAKYDEYLAQFNAARSKPQIPRYLGDTGDKTPPMSMIDFQAEEDQAQKDSIKGIGEAALSMASSIPAIAAGTVAGLGGGLIGKNPFKTFEDVSDALTYQPRTDQGQKLVQKAGSVMQAFPPYGAYVGRITPRGKPAPISPVRNFDNVFTEPAKTFEQGVKTEQVPTQQELLPSNAPQYGINHADNSGMWTQGDTGTGMPTNKGQWVDNTPYRADLSMDVQNMEHPAQRGLFGDDMVPAAGAERSIAQAIDTMPPNTIQRNIALKRLGRNAEDLASPKLDEAIVRADSDALNFELPKEPSSGTGSPTVFGSQRGALNMQMFDDAYQAIKTLSNGVRLIIQGNSSGPRVMAVDPKGKVIGVTKMMQDAWAREPRAGDNMEASWVTTDPNQILGSPPGENLPNQALSFTPPDKTTKSQYPGLATEMYKFVAEQGNDIVASQVQTTDGKKMWEGFRQRGLAQGSRIPRGAVDPRLLTEGLLKIRDRLSMNSAEQGPLVRPPSTITAPYTPEHLAQKKEYQTKLDAIKEKLPEYSDVTTREEAIQLAKESKDISSTKAGQSVASGLNFMTAYHNHPLLKYARKLYTDAREYQTTFSKKFVTNKDTGLASLALKMSDQEKADAIALLQEASTRKIDITPDVLERAGMVDDVRGKFITQFQAAMEQSLADWNTIRAEQGLKPVTRIPGYMPGVFRGDFKSLVFNENKQVIGVVTADSPGQFMLAKQHVFDTFPGATLNKPTVAEARRKLSSNTNNKFVMKDYLDVLAMLAENDPEFAKAQGAIEGIVNQSGKDLFGFDVHSMQKKGVFGNEGNKPWLNEKQNTKQAVDSMLRFIEEGAEFRSLQKPLKETNALLNDKDLAATHPKALEYLRKYSDNAQGSYLHAAGEVFNTTFDTASRLMEATPGLNKYVGPSNLLKGSNYVRNKMAGMYMGWFNGMFTVSQLVQPAQTGQPFLMLVANRLGGQLDQATVGKQMVQGLAQFVKLYNEENGWVKSADVSENTRALFEHGKNNGIFDFSELENAYEGHKTKVGRAIDKTAAASMTFGERYSRGPMFMAFGNLLVENGVPVEYAGTIAQHLTDVSMISYHPYERPMAYSGMGVMGQHAGGLTTFKHGYMGQQALLGKEVGRTGNAAPLAYSALATLMLAGITGAPFYSEIDELYGWTKDKMFGSKGTISRDFLPNTDQWIKTGAVSSAMGLNMQGKFSSADMIPDSAGKALFPHLAGAWDIGAAMIDAAKNQDRQGFANLAAQVTPQGFKQATKSITHQDAKGNILDKNMNVIGPRTEKEWLHSSATGLTPLNESVTRNDVFAGRKIEQADRDAQKTINDEWERALRNNSTEHQLKLILQKYNKRNGDVMQLINKIDDVKLKQRLTEKQRAEGFPDSQQSVRKYKYYNP